MWLRGGGRREKPAACDAFAAGEKRLKAQLVCMVHPYAATRGRFLKKTARRCPSVMMVPG